MLDSITRDILIVTVPIAFVLLIARWWKPSPRRLGHTALVLMLIALLLPAVALPRVIAGWLAFGVMFSPALLLPPVLFSSFANTTFIICYVALLRGSSFPLYLARGGILAAIVAVILASFSSFNIFPHFRYEIEYQPGQLGFGAGVWLSAHVTMALAIGAMAEPRNLRTSRIVACASLAVVALVAGVELLILLRDPEAVEWKRIEQVAFSPDGQLLATAVTDLREQYELEVDEFLTIWDVGAQRKLFSLPLEEGITTFRFSPKGDLLAYGMVEFRDVPIDRPEIIDSDLGVTVVPLPQLSRIPGKSGVVRLMDVDSQALVATLQGHTDEVKSIAFSPGGSLIATAGQDQTIRLWTLPSGELSTTFETVRAVNSIGFAPDGQSLAAAMNDGAVSIFNVLQHTEIAIQDSKTSDVQAVAFSPDGKSVAVGEAHGRVSLLSVDSGRRRTFSRGFNTHTYDVTALSFSPDGQRLATASGDFTVRLWDTATGRCAQTLIGHVAGVNALQFVARGEILVTAGSDEGLKGDIRLWNVETGAQIGRMLGHSSSVLSLATCETKRSLASVGFGETINFWELDSQKLKATWQQEALCAALSPDGNLIATGDFDGNVKLFDVATGNRIGLFAGHALRVPTIAFSPDGKLLASGSGDKTIRLWDVVARAELAVLQGHQDSVYSVSFSPDSTLLVSGSADHTVRLWDIQSRAERMILQRPVNAQSCSGIAYSPSGRALTAVTWDGWINTWDVQTGNLTSSVQGPLGRVTCAELSPGGDLLAYGSYDRAAVLWNMEQNQLLAVLSHPVDVKSLDFGPEGKLLVTGEGGVFAHEGAQALRIWDTATGKESVRLSP